MVHQTSILDIIKQNVQDIIPTILAEQITPANSLKELGANSIDRAEIIMLTLQALRLKVPLAVFSGAKNIGELVDLIQRELVSVASA
jgi:polyketide biosynthesis acyl carrier protein